MKYTPSPIAQAVGLLCSLFVLPTQAAEATAQVVVTDDATSVEIAEALLDGGDEARLRRQAVELLWGEQHGRGLAVLCDDEGPTPALELADLLGEMGLQLADRDDVFGDLEREHGSVF